MYWMVGAIQYKIPFQYLGSQVIFPLISTGCILKEVSGMAVAKHYASDLCKALILFIRYMQ